MTDLAPLDIPARIRHRPLADFIDAQGHRVTAVPAPSGLLAILALHPETGLRDGRPLLNRENAVELRDALTEFIAGAP